MPELSRRKIIGGTLASSAALLAGKTSATESVEPTQTFKTNGQASMTLEEFRTLNGPGSVARLMGQPGCDRLAMCHKRLKEKQGVWIPELVPIFAEIDSKAQPKSG